MRSFFLGLDGMTLNVVEPYVKAGFLPNLKRIMDAGSYGILHSTIPSITGPGWVSLATGKNPGKHGVYEFRKRIHYKGELITKSTSPGAEPIWSILSRNSKNVTVINAPFTYPPDKVNGVMISGFMTPSTDTEFVFPKEVRNEVFDLLPNYRFEVSQKTLMRSSNTNRLSKEIYAITEDVRRLMNHFLDKNETDLFYTVFIGPDRLQHFLWHQVVSMRPECVEYYKLLDDIIGDILNRMDDETVLFIASDHGFEQAKKSFCINNLFRQMGLLHIRGNIPIKKRLGRLKFTTENIERFAVRSGLSKIKKIIPSSVINFANNFIPSKLITESQVDWQKTQVFSLLRYGIISVNLKGRESDGIVQEKDYAQLCEIIRRKLLEVKDPATGQTIVKEVFKGQELYSPECSGDMPDLVVLMKKDYLVREALWEDTISKSKFGKRYVTADHHRDGIFIAYGNNIINNRTDANIYDIMPTMLYLMGVAIPEDVDGRVLTEIISPDFVEKNRIKIEKKTKLAPLQENTLSREESKKIRERLRNLGYLS
ncbi:MAG: alkaline phosphatase family protein [Planctomycetota bacterium]|jgi:predicted AlkP superfamily phosphohydrolase/phosphomutase